MNTATPIWKEVEIIAGAARYWLECGKLAQVEQELDSIEQLAIDQQEAPDIAPALALATAAANVSAMLDILEDPDADDYFSAEKMRTLALDALAALDKATQTNA